MNPKTITFFMVQFGLETVHLTSLNELFVDLDVQQVPKIPISFPFFRVL